ncbi:MAG: hypothetical protein Q7T28_08155 [Cypionkella sp.]|nr:hypothetical protein [Cypionkella sp.]
MAIMLSFWGWRLGKNPAFFPVGGFSATKRNKLALRNSIRWLARNQPQKSRSIAKLTGSAARRQSPVAFRARQGHDRGVRGDHHAEVPCRAG